MTKASKARMLAELEKRLAYYDLLIAYNIGMKQPSSLLRKNIKKTLFY
jgi:hypothetical protein